MPTWSVAGEIVAAAGDDFQAPLVAAAADPVDDPVVSGDPPRPPAGEVAAQQFGLADSGKGPCRMPWKMVLIRWAAERQAITR